MRLGLYHRIDALENDQEGDAMGAELIVRFGPMPGEMDTSLQIVNLKRAYPEAGVEKLAAGLRS